jgi:hypothetical protein
MTSTSAIIPTSRHDLLVQRGFVLPLTLWIVAAIGLVVVAVNQWVLQAVDNGRVLRERADMALAMSDIQNELIFAMGTRPLTYRGMEVGRLVEKVDRTDVMAMMTSEFRTDRFIRMDGRPYRVESHPDFTVRIYDGRGLLNLNAVGMPYLRRMLGLFGMSEQDRNGMVDALEDYIDRDDLTRISGAEERDYLRLDRRPPANAWLTTPLEAQYVLGWDRFMELWQRDLKAPLLSTCSSPGFNPNTASREALLSYFPGMLEEDVQKVLARLEEKPFRNVREFASAAGTVIRDEPFAYVFAPGTCILAEVTYQPTGDRSRFSLTINNIGAKSKPWQIDYVTRIPTESSPADREPLPEAVFPAPDTLDAYERSDREDGLTGPADTLDRQPRSNPESGF